MTALFDQGPPTPCPQQFNLAAHVLARAGNTPAKTALAVLGPDAAERWSYAQIEDLVRRTAAGLLALGLAPGDRVLMRLGNTVEFPLAYLAAIAAGLVAVPTSAQLTVPEITVMAGALSPALIIAAPGIALPENLTSPVLDLPAFHHLAKAIPAPFHMADPERPAYIVFTSGTSGHPRGVVHAHRAIWARQMMMDGWYGLRDSDRMFHAGAFNWTYTLGTGLLDPLDTGGDGNDPGPRHLVHTGPGVDRTPPCDDFRCCAWRLPSNVAHLSAATADAASQPVGGREAVSRPAHRLGNGHRSPGFRSIWHVRMFHLPVWFSVPSRPDRGLRLSPARAARCDPERVGRSRGR